MSEVERAKSLLSKITAWPWVYFGEPENNVFWGQIRSAADEGGFAHITDTPELDERDNDMEFIAAAPELVSGLIAEIEALRRGEFICSRCYLRKDAEPEEGEPRF